MLYRLRASCAHKIEEEQFCCASAICTQRIAKIEEKEEIDIKASEKKGGKSPGYYLQYRLCNFLATICDVAQRLFNIFLYADCLCSKANL